MVVPGYLQTPIRVFIADAYPVIRTGLHKTLSRFKRIVMPGTIAQAKIMQPAGNFHHHVTDAVLPVADFVLHDPAALHPTDRMLNPHFLACNAAVLFFLFQREVATTGLLHWLAHRHRRDSKSLKPPVLIERTIRRQTIRCIINNRFLMPFSCIRWAHVLNDTRRSNQQNILYRVTFLLSTVIFLLLIGIYRSLDGTFGAIMVKKGALSNDAVAASDISVAVRDGSAPSCRNAHCKTGLSSCNHLFATDCRIPNRRPWTSWVRFCFIWTSMNSSLSSIVGNGEFLYVTYRRFSRGRPSMVFVCIASKKHASNAGTSAANSVGVRDVKASRLVSLSATS